MKLGIPLLLLALAGWLTLVTSCRLVSAPRSSSVTAEVADCVHDCNADFGAAQQAERERHVTAVQACAGDSTCLADEQALHEANQGIAVEAMQTCKRECYNEGGGGSR
jgi:hypothetical protein